MGVRVVLELMCACVCVSRPEKLQIPGLKRLYKFNMRVVKERSEPAAGKRRNISSRMSKQPPLAQSH